MEYGVLKGVIDAIADGNTLWIISDCWNVLFQYSLDDDKVILAEAFPKEISADGFAFLKMMKIENEIYLIPQNAKDIFCYNITKRKFSKFNISTTGFQETLNMGAVVKGQCIYCVNRFPDVVIKIDTITKEVTQFDIDHTEYINKDMEKYVYRTYKKPCIYKDKIIFSNYGGILTIFDLKSETVSREILKEIECDLLERTKTLYKDGLRDWIVDIYSANDALWLVSFNGKIYQYKNGDCSKKESIYNDCLNDKDADMLTISFFGEIASLGKNIWFLPQYKNRCMRYDLVTKKFKKSFDAYQQNWEGEKREYTVCTVFNEKEILLYSYYEGSFYILNPDLGLITKKRLKISFSEDSQARVDFMRLCNKDNIFKFDALPLFLDEIYKEKEYKRAENLNVGKRIYEIIKEGR